MASPVVGTPVPRKEDRIRVQLSAAHSEEMVDRALGAFERVGRKLRVLSR